MEQNEKVGIKLEVKDGASASVKKVSGNFDKLGKSAQDVAKSLTAITALSALQKVTAPINKIRDSLVKGSLQISDSIAAISARSDIAVKTLHDVVDESASVGSAALNVGNSAERILAATDKLTRAGVLTLKSTSAEISKMSNLILNLESVYGESYDAYSGYADMLGDNFKLTTNELADCLAYAELSATKVGGAAAEFFEVLKNEGSFMHRSLNMNVKDVMDSLTGLAAGTSQPAKKVGATLNSMFEKLRAPSQEAIKALNELGIARDEVFDSDGHLAQVSGENPIVTFLKHFDGANIEQLSAIFGSATASNMSALLGALENVRELSAADMGNPVEEVEKRARAAKGLFGELGRTLSIFKNTAFSILTPIGDFLAGIVRRFNDWFANSSVARNAAALGSVFMGLGVSLALAYQKAKLFWSVLRLDIVVKTIKVVGSTISKIFGFVLRLMPHLLKGLISVIKMAPALLQILKTLTRTLMHSPLFWAMLALDIWVPVIKQLYERWDDFCLGVSYLIDMLKEEFFGFIDSIMEAWSDFWRVFDYLIYTAKEWFANFVDGVKSYFYGLIDGIKEKIQQLVGYLPDFVKTKLGLSITSNNPAVDHVTAGEVHDAMKAAHAARVGGDVNVNFANAPAGMRVTTEPRPGTTLPTNVGYNLLSPAWGMGG